MLNTSDLQARLAAAQAAQKPGKPIELKISGGPDRGKSHDVLAGESLVGRGLDCQIVLADPAVSRKHFKIVRTGDEAVLMDLGGANGTLVNGQKVQRKVLEPGDRIDVGTSVLEVVIDGQASKVRSAPVPMRPVTEESGPMHAEPVAASKPAGGRKWLIPAVIGVLLLVIGGVAAWLLLAPAQPAPAGDGEAPAEGAAGAEGDEAARKKLLAEAKTLIEDGEFEEAKDLLRKPRKQYPDDEELQSLYKKAKAEAANQEKLTEAKEALAAKDYAGAFDKLGSIPKDSDLFADAEEELTSARSRYADERLREASAVMATDSAKAVAILDELLQLLPDNAAAKALRAQLNAPGDVAAGAPAAAPAAGAAAVAPAAAAPTAAGAAPAAAMAGKDTGVKDAPGKEPAAKPAVAAPPEAAAKAPAPAAGVAAAAAPKPAAPAVAGARADFSRGLAAYKRRAWTEAVQAFTEIADGPYAKADKVRATRYVSAVKAVESAMNDAKAASGVAAAKAWRRAYDNDKEVDGSQAAFLIKTTAQAWLDAAKKAKADGKFDDAMEYAQESQNYEELPEAAQIIAACKQKATELLAQAKDNMKKGNYATAGDQARKVAKILGAADPRSAEAIQLAKDAAEKARGED